MEVHDKGDHKVISNMIDGQQIFFTICHEIDVIQRHHQKGLFYEPEEISTMAAHVPEGAVILDIGTNVGNHALWFAKYKAAKKIYLFEPNPEVLKVLRSNIALNGLEGQVVTDFLGIGLGAKAEGGFRIQAAEKNLGGGRMFPGGGDLEIRPGDAVVAQTDEVDFIKIDVERMELKVLEGLKRTIARCRPPIFVEVDREHLDAFETWLTDNQYTVEITYQRSKRNINHMCLPQPI